MTLDTELHVTFLYHCAIAPAATDPSVHVLLAPSSAGMEHVAGLRLPVDLIVEDQTGTDEAGKPLGIDQQTEYLREGRLTTTTDRTWRLEGYHVSIDPPNGVTPNRPRLTLLDTSPDPASSSDANGDEPVRPRAIARIDDLTPFRIDSACLAYDPPRPLWEGARVQVWGGTLTCGVPDDDLDNRLWQVGKLEETRLSDRVEFKKRVGTEVVLTFRKFGETNERRLVLRAPAGDGQTPIRLYVSNDPKPLSASHHHAGSGDNPHEDRCSLLPHFPSYDFLLHPAGRKPEGSNYLPSPPYRGFVDAPPDHGLLVLEGDTVCCPCSYGTPRP